MKSINRMKNIINTLCIIAATLSFYQSNAQTPPQQPKAPELEYCLRLDVKTGESYSVGDNHKGERNIVPIIGGTFEGKLPGREIKGDVLPGGADYQMKYEGRNELEAIYTLRTDDGVNILVNNFGLVVMGKGMYYFRCTPTFEAPSDSKYDWMNNSIFICQPDFRGMSSEGIVLDVWRVK